MTTLVTLLLLQLPAPAGDREGRDAEGREPEGRALEGRWWGSAGFPEDRIDEGYEIRRNSKQELEVLLWRPVVNFYGLQLPGTLVKQGEAWVLKSYGITFRREGERLVGTEEPFRSPFTLERATTFSAETPLP